MVFILLNYKFWGIAFALLLVFSVVSALGIATIPAALIAIPLMEVTLGGYIGTYAGTHIFHVIR
jgi:hypothetical protein